MRILISVLLSLAAACVLAQTVTVPPQSCSAVITCQGVQITLPSSAPAPSPTPAPTPAPAPSGVTWMYLNGAKTAWGDFSGSTTNWFNATTAGFNGDRVDIRVSGGCFIPVWASNYQLPNPGWHYFLISMRPTSSNAVGIHFEPRVNGDADIYRHINLADSSAKYGPVPKAGVWASYKIPMADLMFNTLTNAVDPAVTSLYKAVLACDGATYEFDAIGFQ